jgi:hypothetical protein
MNIEALAEELLNDLDVEQSDVRSINTFKSPGRGHKLCPKCNVYVGVRAKRCACAHEFKAGEKTQTNTNKNSAYDEPLTDEEKRYLTAIGLGKGGRVIHVGAGESPAQLMGITQEHINDFCETVISYGLTQDKLYMPRAIKNWARSMLSLDITIQNVHNMIDVWYGNKVASTIGVVE